MRTCEYQRPCATQSGSAFGLDVPDRLIALADEVIE